MSAVSKPPAVKRPAIASSAKGKPLRKPNPVRQIIEREQRAREQSAAAAKASSASAVAASSGINRGSSQCPNKACPNPNVVDGTCQTCGRVADDSNIVAEVQFGETSSGAAVVQGSYLGADQGGVRVGGPSFRRVAGSGANEARDRTLKEAKVLMQQYAHRLNLPPSLAESGYRLYRMAAMNNFVQGRRIPNVVAMCLYAACRKEQNSKVMLIDLADLCKENVFKLGRNYKAFLAKFPEVKEGPNPVIMEDLIYRFASKLEFYEHSNKIALSAVRIAKRMQADHMTHGRRPAGICGAAVIMAARAHSFRRTVREVVYIAKVTTHTLQLRMDEFANVPSAQMTIDEFHTNKFLDEQSDPPWWYKNSAAWKAKHPGRKRKIQELRDDDDDDGNTPAAESNGDKRQKTVDADAQAAMAVDPSTSIPVDPAILPSPSPSPAPVPQQTNPSSNTDKDGFVIPPLPARRVEAAADEDRAALLAARGGAGELQLLAEQFGDPDAIPERSTEAAMAAAQGINVPSLVGRKTGGTAAKAKGKAKKDGDRSNPVAFDEEWLADEAALEDELESHLHNPEMMSMAITEARQGGDDRAVQLLEEFAKEQRLDDEHTDQTVEGGVQDGSAGETATDQPTGDASPNATDGPPPRVKEDPIVTEDEFADDPEVKYCLLGPAEVKIKMQIWTNENEDWMRGRQTKEHQKKLAAKGPPKKTRNRTKVPRIGEGQASPASSAGEAAISQLKMRAVSKKINYQAFEEMFNTDYHRPGSMYDGTSTSATSRAGSVAPSEAESAAGDQDPRSNPEETVTEKESDRAKEQPPAPGAQEEENAADDEEDYDETGYDDDQGDYPEDIDPFADNNGGNDEEEGEDWE